MDNPLFGKRKQLVERIDSIDSNWYVEIWEEHYYFLRMEVYVRKEERLIRNKPTSNEVKVR